METVCASWNSRHVDGDHVLLAAIERLGERQRGLGLADAGRAAEHEHADRLVRIVELGAVRLDALGDHLQAVRLADDAPVQDVGEAEDRLDLVLDHAADRNAGPVGDDGGDRLLVDMRVDHARCSGSIASERMRISRAASARVVRMRRPFVRRWRLGRAHPAPRRPSYAVGRLRSQALTISRSARISSTSSCSELHSASSSRASPSARRSRPRSPRSARRRRRRGRCR